MTSFVENDMRKSLECYGNILLERIISLLSGITTEKAQVYSDALKSSDVSWYGDTFGMMH